MNVADQGDGMIRRSSGKLFGLKDRFFRMSPPRMNLMCRRRRLPAASPSTNRSLVHPRHPHPALDSETLIEAFSAPRFFCAAVLMPRTITKSCKSCESCPFSSRFALDCGQLRQKNLRQEFTQSLLAAASSGRIRFRLLQAPSASDSPQQNVSVFSLVANPPSAIRLPLELFRLVPPCSTTPKTPPCPPW